MAGFNVAAPALDPQPSDAGAHRRMTAALHGLYRDGEVPGPEHGPGISLSSTGSGTRG
ncbi:hypothetical protein NBCG_03223 [Nocardioidaceae bacterium Broad-1]|nr:hypothetical protein NBCG_03223 [Nocardioidaceae bacterium Broad-1]